MSATTTTTTTTTTIQLEMAKAIEPGSLGNLTVDQSRILQESWVQILRLCRDESTRDFRQGLWNFMTSEHPDATILRFLRARKWDTGLAMDMLKSAVDWRKERQISSIIQMGENVGLSASPSTDEQGFMAQYRSGKSYVRGTDKEGRPIYTIKVRLHDPNLQSAASMEMFVLHNIESLRMMVKAPSDKCCLIFDLTGFGLRNMDFHVVRFLVQVFEARYPETLGVVLIHNAPFVFWGIWNVIKRWLDPVIASKINFTNSTKDLARFIHKTDLQTCYGGEDGWEYKYVEPVPGDEKEMQSEQAGKIKDERNDLIDRFEQLTAEWADLVPGSASAIDKESERCDLAKKLHDNYWRLDPYTRAKTFYHRVGVVDNAGNVDFGAAK